MLPLSPKRQATGDEIVNALCWLGSNGRWRLANGGQRQQAQCVVYRLLLREGFVAWAFDAAKIFEPEHRVPVTLVDLLRHDRQHDAILLAPIQIEGPFALLLD